MEILALLQCLHPFLPVTTVRQFSRIALAMLAMTGRVTMLGIARWSGKGGSQRTVQRFFCTVIPWAALFWVFFRQHVYHWADTYLLAGDAVVVTKAGKPTQGLDRFFSSLYGKPGPGLAIFALALVSVQERRSFPVRVEQVVRSAAEKAASKATAEAKKRRAPSAKRRPGRPPGSKNTSKADVRLTPELLRITHRVEALLKLSAGLLPLTYLVLDGHFGNHTARQMVQPWGVQLISKLRSDSALYLPDNGPYAGRGPHRQQGSKVDYRNRPEQYLKATTVEGHVRTCLYQAELRHKEFSQPLHVVILVKTNLQTPARAHVVLFSSDRELTYDKLVDYQGLRFQIEFNFRDAKPYWGLEDFMTVTDTAVTTAATLALFMVNLSYRLLSDLRQSDPSYSMLDLKAQSRGYKYVAETIKLLPHKPAPVLLAQIFNTVACLGRIHAIQPCFNPS